MTKQSAFEALKSALEEIESISPYDFGTGKFPCKEIPANWGELAIIKAHDIARTALTLFVCNHRKPLGAFPPIKPPSTPDPHF